MSSSKKNKAIAPDKITEEYYQISLEILNSFPKYRPPVDLFQFKEEIASLYPYIRKGARFTNDQVAEVQVLCEDGLLFVSRADLHIYSAHIIKQVDLVLQDSNIKESEAADIIVGALALRLGDFVDQPVLPVFELLYRDVMVLTEFIVRDEHRTRLFVRRLHTGEHSLVQHSLNTLFVGLWLFINHYVGNDFKRRQLDRSCLALILHDIGMSRIPAFILSKKTPLKNEEKDKILLHQLAGIKIMQKIDMGFDEMKQAILEHHERLNGSGYPNKTKEASLSKFGKLCMVADSFAAMITERPYAPAKPFLQAAQELADDARYENRFTKALAHACLTNSFDAIKQPPPAEK